MRQGITRERGSALLAPLVALVLAGCGKGADGPRTIRSYDGMYETAVGPGIVMGSDEIAKPEHMPLFVLEREESGANWPVLLVMDGRLEGYAGGDLRPWAERRRRAMLEAGGDGRLPPSGLEEVELVPAAEEAYAFENGPPDGRWSLFYFELGGRALHAAYPRAERAAAESALASLRKAQ